MSLSLGTYALSLLLAIGAQSQGSDDEQNKKPPPTRQTPDREEPPVIAVAGRTGLEVSSPDGRYRMHLWFRAQLRYTYPFNTDPLTAADFDAPPKSTFSVQRARIKLGGNAYREWLRYYFEYDVRNNRLLDLRFTLARISWLQLRIGQWKVNYNRERVDSSGKLQFVDRSIVTPFFTVDRQPGVMLAGHLWGGRLADSWYFFGVFNGNGPNSDNDDGSMMWQARYQWQFFGRDLPFSESDIEFHEEPAASLSFATVRNTSPFTAFSSAGGGELPGFEPGAPGQYSLTQYLEETALKYRGFSFQHEFHWKEVLDNVDATITNLRGTYIQAGYLPWGGTEHVLKPLEIAGRYAWVDPDTARPDDDLTELTVGGNWFFAGHENKVSVDASRIRKRVATADGREDYRLRVQWDISF